MKFSVLKVALAALLLVGCCCNVLQVSVEPTAREGSDLKFDYCVLASPQSYKADNQEYFQSIKSQIPQSGQHFLSSMALFFRGQPNEQANKMSLLQNLGFIKYVAFAGFGMIILVFFIIQATLRVTFEGEGRKNEQSFYRLKAILSFIGIVGLVLCFAYITNYSFEGIKENGKIKDGLDHFACTNELMERVHTADGKSYSVADIPDIFFRMEEAITRIRLKNNRVMYYSDRILQNAGSMGQLMDRAKVIYKQNGEAKKDAKNAQFLQELARFKIIYENMRNGITLDMRKFPLFDHVIKAREELLPYKNSMLHAREVTKTTAEFVQDFVSTPQIVSLTQWLKFLYVFFIVVGVYALANVYFIVLRRTNNIKKMVVYVIAAACFIAFVLAITLSIVIPYFVWGCQGSNYAFSNNDNLKSELQKSRVLADTQKTLAIFSPQSQFKVGSIINRERVDSFKNLAAVTKAFIDQKAKANGQELAKKLKEFFLKYDGQKQIEKLNGVIAALQDKNFDSIRLLHLQALEVMNLLDQRNGVFGSINPNQVGKTLQRNVDSLCIPNFNSLYETREKMVGIAYALLLSLFFILFVRNLPRRLENGKLDRLEESKLEVMKYAMEQNTEDIDEPSGREIQRQ